MEWRGLWVLSEGCNLLDGYAGWTQHSPRWTCLGHWSPAESPSSSLVTLNKTEWLGCRKWRCHIPCTPCHLSSGTLTSGAGVSQRTTNFILSRRHSWYQQHVGYWTKTIVRGQATLFISWSNGRRSAYACADVHRAPAFPPTRLFVSTHPEWHTGTVVCSRSTISKDRTVSVLRYRVWSKAKQGCASSYTPEVGAPLNSWRTWKSEDLSIICIIVHLYR